MFLKSLHIKNYRRIDDAEIHFDNATFIIGKNNTGKTSILKAVEALLTLDKIEDDDFYKTSTENSNQITLEARFHKISEETKTSRGYKGRIINGEFCYKKTFTKGDKKPKFESKVYPSHIKEEFATAQNAAELITLGLPEDVVNSRSTNLTKRFTAGWEKEYYDYVLEYETGDPVWEENPGGIPQNVLSKLPKVLYVPSVLNEDDLSNASGKNLIGKILDILFDDLLSLNQEGLDIKTQIEAGLNALTQLMSRDEGSLTSTLQNNINGVISSVFPQCGIIIKPNMTDFSSVIKPQYNISFTSNIETRANYQGTGLLRTSIFSMLRYHYTLSIRNDDTPRPIIFCFEEPELYLHPSAANMLRSTIYELAQGHQIICTTHSPWMIDLSQNLQSLTKLTLRPTGSIKSICYGLSDALNGLVEDDKMRVKMLQAFDDHVARAFFCDMAVVVEGNTEEVVIDRTISLLPSQAAKDKIKSTIQVINAHGKATIISMVKYLKALEIDFHVIHDRDNGVDGAMVFNEPIANVINDENKLTVLHECIEDELGYTAPTSDKPFKAYKEASRWTTLADIPHSWLEKFGRAFGAGHLVPTNDQQTVDAAELTQN